MENIGKWWFNGGWMAFYGIYSLVNQYNYMENHHAWWEDLFRLGHLPVRKLLESLPECGWGSDHISHSVRSADSGDSLYGVSWNRGSPKIIRFNGSFHSKPSIWGLPSMENPHLSCDQLLLVTDPVTSTRTSLLKGGPTLRDSRQRLRSNLRGPAGPARSPYRISSKETWPRQQLALICMCVCIYVYIHIHTFKYRERDVFCVYLHFWRFLCFST